MTQIIQKIVNTQNSRIHVLLTKLDKMAYKADYVIELTNGAKAHVSELDFDEANKLIEILDREEKEAFRQKLNARRNSEDVQRKKIISCCREMGWIKNGKADMERIYSWVLKFGYLHKGLNQYSAKELPQLVTQAEMMKSSYLSGSRQQQEAVK